MYVRVVRDDEDGDQTIRAWCNIQEWEGVRKKNKTNTSNNNINPER